MTTAKVFVGSLPPGCKPEELRLLFTSYGVVVECDIMNRCGFVHMETTDTADAAIAALNGTDFKGQSIVVERGRPKDRKGAGNRGPAGGVINRRPMQGHGDLNNGPSVSAGNFSRGGHMGGNHFRGGGAGGTPNRGSNFANGNNFGPMRNEGNNRQQRNTPYSKGPPQQNTDGPPGFKNKYNQGGGGHKFGGGANNFGNATGSRFGGQMNNQFQSWDNSGPGGYNNANNAPGNRRNFKNSPSSGPSDFHAGNSGGGGSVGLGFGNQRGGGGASNNVGQDRRGFALPAVDHHQQQQQVLPFGAHQGRFGNGNGPILANGNNADNAMFQRNRNNPAMNSGNLQSGRGGFTANRGGFNAGAGGRGGFNPRRGCGAAPSNERSIPQNHGGGFNNRGPPNINNQNASNAYQTEFPALGSQGGGLGNRNRNNGPRPNMRGNRRY